MAQDTINLQRFVGAQQPVYDQVLDELRSGRKRTHWMWFIFPQIAGLGHSSTAQRYAIKNAEEARQYLAHPVLGQRLRECATILLNLQGRSASEIFGYPDDLKLKSSMTLFAQLEGQESVFAQVLDTYFQGQPDDRTIALLNQHT
jgi:uncharacterized protein (DUF1810 family)